MRFRKRCLESRSGGRLRNELRNLRIEKPQRLGSLRFMTVVIAKPSERQVKKEVQGMRQAAKSLASSPAKARAFLIEKGYITQGNKLTRRYG
jgi:hypothetical protein